MKILYLDPISGVSGDMMVGALLQLGLPLPAVREAIAMLGLAGVEVAAEPVLRSGIAATQFSVRVADAGGRHHHGHHHPHRPYAHVRDLVAGSALPEPVRATALAVFARLAEAEGRVHGIAPEAVEFHEVGALDAIVDVVGTALGVAHLGVDAVYAGPLPLGRGRIDAAHGPLPVPAPAVVELVRGRPVRLEDGAAELVTPTGAAIVAALARLEAVPELRVAAVGYGAGQRTLADRPNVLRLLVGEAVVAPGADEVVALEATIDDLNPQLYEHVLERLLAAGAREAFLVPALMKKSRPGTLLTVLAAPADRERLAAIVFAETSTIGLRWRRWHRMVLPREERSVDTPWGAVRVKVSHAPDGTPNVAPEFEDCRRLARERGVPLKRVHQAAIAAALRQPVE